MTVKYVLASTALKNLFS